jgi:hypothetical protein
MLCYILTLVSSQFCSQKCPEESTPDTSEKPGYFTSAKNGLITPNVYHFTAGGQTFGVMVQKENVNCAVLQRVMQNFGQRLQRCIECH